MFRKSLGTVVPMINSDFILIGNSFPMVLIRRAVRIMPVALSDLKRAGNAKRVISFWGHTNTLAAAEAFCGLNLTPDVARPVLILQQNGLPVLGNQVFCECWVLSPDYRENIRPAVGEEVSADQIKEWQILKITWE